MPTDSSGMGAITEAVAQLQPIWTLLGVVMGFLLGEGSRFIREKARVRKLCKSIRIELESIKRQIPFKKDIVNQIIDALKQKKMLPGLSVPIISIAYGNSISEVYGHLSQRERDCLHVIHEKLRNCDTTLATFQSEFLAVLKEGVVNEPFATYIKYFLEVNQNYDTAIKLIDSYLSGQPIEVFGN